MNSKTEKIVGDICSQGITMLPEEKAVYAYEFFEKNLEHMEICIVDKDQKFTGLLTRNAVMKIFGGRYGYTLHQRNTVSELANKNALVVYKNYTIEDVSRLAMERTTSKLYDAVVVLDEEQYYGVVTIKDLLTATLSIQVERAIESNPLTSLPGNQLIDKKIHELIGTREFYAVMYLDLDNFKAYNDAYGFSNGDKMIKALAEAMEKVYADTAFLGHVGGDDFVVITRQTDVKERAEKIITLFRNSLEELYSSTDWERGYIISKNRSGETEQFPIASVSIAIVTNRDKCYEGMMLLNNQIVIAKKRAKQIAGNSIIII